MKISQMTTDQATTALCRIAPPATRIFADQAAIPMIQEVVDAFHDDHTAEAITAVMMRVVPYLLKDHKEDVYEIIGGLYDKTAQQIGKQSFLQTMQMVKESVDQELVNFFTHSGSSTKTGDAG